MDNVVRKHVVRTVSHANYNKCVRTLYMVNEEYPKLDPSKPRATSVNCCAASLVFLRERDLIRKFR